MNKFELQEPLNANERFLHAIAIRLDAVIHILSSLTEAYANEKGLATTSNEVKIDEVPVEETKKRRSRKVEKEV